MKNVYVDVDRETVAKVNSFKYIGAIKSNTGSCSEDINARIGRAKKATKELDQIWKVRGIRKELKDETGESAHMASHYTGSRRMDFKER